MQKTILITGCSSGIGAAMAREFQRRGHRVFASARRPDGLAPLADAGIETLPLDVNDADSVAAAMAYIGECAGHLDMLVNNAGLSRVGAAIDLGREDLRQQFETNVIAPIALARAALPLLLAARAGGTGPRIVNVGSIVGLFTTPFTGAYCASKAALHALSDALRMELAPLGIRVITLQPGGVLSSFGDNAEAGIRLPQDSLYQPIAASIHARSQAGQQNATPTEAFVAPVVTQLLGKRPPAVIRGGRGSIALVWLRRLLPLRVFDAVMARKFGLANWQPGGR
ncbi:SDR family NAD(P)-dependent oxidoreductase [Haliea sp. E17]|uniref:SDR family NAD(P)-dependent oxidoreductase n=1 Tax=Haliea sp. E17 TaxID=3401576 RepID=UPI003AAC85F2